MAFLNFEESRLKTFERTWPHSFISPRVLARTGFYFVGPFDRVQCYFCNIQLGQWVDGDDEIDEHIRWSPYCPFLNRCETSNISSYELVQLKNDIYKSQMLLLFIILIFIINKY